jgi:aspartyl-tRNA(Asn)/glutamyl-tRNA(Gln) amidotransferase subunit B
MKYEVVIGMEIHTELSTESKIFCGCSTKFGSAPNSQVCPVCLGMPGVLPVLNKTALEYTIRTAMALNCDITERTIFDRKNYYYPDLPKNYQISQNYASLGYNGFVDINVNGKKKRIRINNVHLEEDAGKSIHPESAPLNDDYSLVDLNRTGMALIEIVSEPDMYSTDDVMAYMQCLKNLLQYIEVSDCKMQEGHLRFEVNISIRPEGSDKLGTRAEIKNLNSMKIAIKCVEYEIRRQSEILDSGGTVKQETRLWDDLAMQTRAMRSKEHAQDYRYFPDPDLVEVHITKEWQEKIRKNIPELQDAKSKRFQKEYGLPAYDAEILTLSKPLATYYEECLKYHKNPKLTSNWIMTELLRELNKREMEPDECPITPKHLASMIKMIDKKIISGKIGKQVFSEMLETAKMPEAIVKEKGLVQISDESALESIIDTVMKENPEVVEGIRNGEEKKIGFLIGQVMRSSRGKANPGMVNNMLREKILNPEEQ